MTESVFTEITKMLKTAYRREGFLCDNETMDLWFRLLEDVDDDLAMKSAVDWVKLSAYPPTIADIRKGVAVYEEARQSKREWVRMEYNTINYPHKDAEDEAVFYSLVYDLPEEKWVRGAQYLNWVANETVKNAVDDVPKLEDVLRKAAKK